MSIDLTTHYGGLKLKSSIVVGACPMTERAIACRNGIIRCRGNRVALAVSGASAALE